MYKQHTASGATARSVTISLSTQAQGPTLTQVCGCVQDNTSWLRLLTHLQADSVPHKCVECLRDLKAMHEAMTIDDIYEAYSQVRTTAACGSVLS